MIKKIIFSFLIGATIAGCSKNTVTGRSQIKLLPESELQSMATTQYQQFLATNKVVSANGNRDAEMVTRVGQRIKMPLSHIMPIKACQKNWKVTIGEYHLVDSKEANAWCMPGGKSWFTLGCFPIPRMRQLLAVVIGS
jgi:hypothetical protein